MHTAASHTLRDASGSSRHSTAGSESDTTPAELTGSAEFQLEQSEYQTVPGINGTRGSIIKFECGLKNARSLNEVRSLNERKNTGFC
jgi:hypothetical protein